MRLNSDIWNSDMRTGYKGTEESQLIWKVHLFCPQVTGVWWNTCQSGERADFPQSHGTVYLLKNTFLLSLR